MSDHVKAIAVPTTVDFPFDATVSVSLTPAKNGNTPWG